MRTAGIFTLVAALAAPLVHSVAIGNDLTLRNNDDPRTMASWSYKNCGACVMYRRPRQLVGVRGRGRCTYIVSSVYSGTSGDLVDLKYIKVSPDPPVPGEDLTVTAAGFVKETIEVL